MLHEERRGGQSGNGQLRYQREPHSSGGPGGRRAPGPRVLPYIDEVGGNNNSLDYQFLGVNSSVLVVANKMKLMDLGNKMVQQWTDHTIYGVAELAEGRSYVKKIWRTRSSGQAAAILP